MPTMKRLTKHRADGTPRMSCSQCPEFQPNCNGHCMEVLVERLAAIEDRLGQDMILML